MAIAFDNAWFKAGTSPFSLTVTCAPNAVLFAFAALASGTISALTCNGNPFSSLAGCQTQTLQGWIFSAPPTGVSTIKLHWLADGVFQNALMVASYTGHDTTNYVGTCKGQSSGAAVNFNVSASSTATDFVIVGIRCTSATADVVTINNGTTRIAPISDSTHAIVALADIGGAPSVTLSATCVAAHAWDACFIPLHAAAGVSIIPLKCMLGVGT